MRPIRTLGAVYHIAAFLTLALVPGVLSGQEDPFGYGTPDNPGEIDFDRPESWAMKYFTSVSLLTGLGVPGGLDDTQFTIGFEGGFIPATAIPKAAPTIPDSATGASNRSWPRSASISMQIDAIVLVVE